MKKVAGEAGLNPGLARFCIMHVVSPLIHSIRNIRTSLLCEHTGLNSYDAAAGLSGAEKLVEYLDRIAGTEGARLRFLPVEMILDGIPLISALKFKELSLDPSKPYPEMLFNRLLEPRDAIFFATGITPLNELLTAHKGEKTEKKSDRKGGGLKLKTDLSLEL